MENTLILFIGIFCVFSWILFQHLAAIRSNIKLIGADLSRIATALEAMKQVSNDAKT